MNYLELSFTLLEKGYFIGIVDERLNEIEFEIKREKFERLNLKFISHKNKNKWNLSHFTN